jgi:hypothetical protein
MFVWGGKGKMSRKGISKILGLLMLASVLFPFLTIDTRLARARTSTGSPNFWLLAIEVMKEYQERDGQRLITELLQYPNWNNSTEFTSHIHLLSEYQSEELSDEVQSYLVGFPFRTYVQREITDFLGQAIPGDIVVIYIMCHGLSGCFVGIGVSVGELNDWLSLGNLPLCYVTIITESCHSGSSINDGEGGILGPNHNVLCGCLGSQGCSGWAGEGNYMFFSHLLNEGLQVGEDSDNDGWISPKEAFNYAKPITEQWIWDAFHWDQNPVSYYGQAGGNVPLVQRDTTKALPHLPPLINVLSPQNITYTKIFIPCMVVASEPLSWMSYSLDDMPNVTISADFLLSGLPDGSHSIVFYGRDDSGNIGSSLKTFFYVLVEVVPAILTLQPDMMKLGSPDKLLFAYLDSQEGLDLTQVDASSINCNGTIPPEYMWFTDYDNDNVTEFAIVFDWTRISELALCEHVFYGNLILALNGQLHDGTLFVGTGIVIVRMPGDICIDGRVDMRDVSTAARAFGCCSGESRWNPTADENEDGRVDLRDIGLIAKHFGEHYP